MLAKICPNFENPKVTGKNFDVHLGKNDGVYHLCIKLEIIKILTCL